MKKRIAAGLLLTAMLPIWTACGTQETEVISSAPEETPVVTEAPLKLLGTEKKGENVYHLKIANRTGKDITGFAVNTELLEGENLLPAGDEFKNGETRELWFDAEAALKAAAEAAEANAPEATPEFILALTLDDGSTQAVHAFPFGDAEECDIRMEEDLTFLVYDSAAKKETVNTRDAEKAARELEQQAKEQAAAEEAARAQAAAEEAARAQAAAEQAAREAQQNTAPADNSGDDGGDGCVDDGLTWD